jgi:hypothetical protein
MMPLSQVLAYNTEHLVDAAAHWQGLADQREEVFATVQNEARTLPWEGQAADALHQRTQSDYNTAMESAGNLRQAAMIAKDGASTLDQMHSRVLYTLEDAQGDGFAPTEALAFVDTRPSTNPAVVAQRQAQAQAYTGQLQSQVADLVTHDTQVGTDMTNATAGEGKIKFVDHTFKTDSSNQPIPDPPYDAPAGKTWNYFHDFGGVGGSWELQDALQDCSGTKEFWEVAGIPGSYIAGIPEGTPGIVGATIVSGGLIGDLYQCKAP